LVGATFEVNGVEAMANSFYPEVINVLPGDTIVFQNGGEVHTVTFGPTNDIQDYFVPPTIFNYFAPSGTTNFDGTNVVNSGIFFPFATFNVTIDPSTPLGTYKYRCMLHPLMVAYVIVGTTRDSQATVTANANDQRSDDAEDAPLIYNLAQTDLNTPLQYVYPNSPSPVPATQVILGIGNGEIAFLRFFPQNITVTAGTTVRYINRDPFEPHTVTFGTPADDTIPEGGNVLTAQTTVLNSGWIWPAVVGGLDYFDLTFQDAGTYEIVCAIHQSAGMVSWVTVV